MVKTIHEYEHEFTNMDKATAHKSRLIEIHGVGKDLTGSVEDVQLEGWEDEMSPLAIDTTENDLTYRIIGAAMSVHNALGYGYREEVYEKALHVELQNLGIEAEEQYPLSVTHKGEQVGMF